MLMPQAKYDLSVLNFILALKNLDFAPKYERNPDGVITSSTNKGILAWGEGRTRAQSCVDLIRHVRACADLYFDDLERWYEHNPEDFPYVLKVMCTGNLKLARLLGCEITEEDFVEVPDDDYYVRDIGGRYIVVRVRQGDDDAEIEPATFAMMRRQMGITDAEFNAGLK